MTNKIYMYAFDNHSESGSKIAEKLEIKKISHANSKFPGGPSYTVINWGSSNCPPAVLRSRIINPPQAVARAINKRCFFEWVGDKARCIPWTTDKTVAQQWLADGLVYCRKKLEGYEGQGIQVVGINEELPDAKLYTKEVRTDKEYRVHVINGKAIAVHRKVNDTVGSIPDGKIKNTENGWKFKRVTVFNEDIPNQAIKAVAAVGLDFAAVDVLWDGTKAWVLEANTAPGIYEMSWTVDQYVKAFKDTTSVLVKEILGQ